MLATILLPVLLLATCEVFTVVAQNNNNNWEPWVDPSTPNYNPIWPRRDNITQRTTKGIVKGFTMEVYWRYYISNFLGIPYADPPTRENRFREPQKTFWHWDQNKIWNATEFRPACPQPLSYLRGNIREYNYTDEDCLYLNIFYPNKTYPPFNDPEFLYPVMVYFHGGEFVRGSAQEYPGFILTQYDVVLVTVNYRLGALGFLSTEDENAKGNYGLWDQFAALEFIKDNIRMFKGNPDSITLFGQDSGAISIGLQMVSPLNINKRSPLFHRAILQSGSDMCEWAVVRPDPYDGRSAKDFARDLARDLGCPTRNVEGMMNCLRLFRHHDEIVNASFNVGRRGQSAGPWAAVVDGANGFLPDYPEKLRQQGHFMPIQVMGGVNRADGGIKAAEALEKLGYRKDAEFGLYDYEFRNALKAFAQTRTPNDIDYVMKILDFEYTYWPQPDNDTARLQMLIDLYSDSLYGTGVDQTIKSHTTKNTTFFYEFGWRSIFSNYSEWMGVVHGDEIQYVFGFPFLNFTTTNTTGIDLMKAYDDMDRNMSEYMIIMWTYFATYGAPTPADQDTPEQLEMLRNTTWFHYDLKNLTWLDIDDNSTNWKDYRQDHFAFWRTWFSNLVEKWPDATTLAPTPAGRSNFETASYATAAFCGLFLIIVIVLVACILMKKRSKPAYAGEANKMYDM